MLVSLLLVTLVRTNQTIADALPDSLFCLRLKSTVNTCEYSQHFTGYVTVISVFLLF